VALHPALPRPELWRRLGAATAVLCPGIWEEPFGLVVAESMATGIPVVAFRLGALAEIIEDGVTGRLVDPGDLAAAARRSRHAGHLSRSECRRHAVTHLD